MAPTRLPDQTIQPRRDDSEDEYISDEEDIEKQSDVSRNESKSGSDSSDDEDDDASNDQNLESEDEGRNSSQPSDSEPEDLKSISFGALAKAQEAFAPPLKSRKRKLAALNADDETPNHLAHDQHSPPQPQQHTNPIDNPHPTRDVLSKKPLQSLSSRSSKHAPAVLSSRNPVSRKREILTPPPAQRSRDPRFDPTITSATLNEASIARADKAYSFLTAYQADEILSLKSQLKKAEHGRNANATEAAALKKKLMSMESRVRNAAAKSKEREILAAHKAGEKQAIREGRKSRPYFLKKSEVKKKVELDRVEGMGKKQKETMEKRRRMREKKKEARDMPWARRMG